MKHGTHHSLETRKLISVNTCEAMSNPEVRKRILKSAFKKGGIPWNKDAKGIHLSPESEFKDGVNVGSNHPSWKGGVQNISKDCVYVWAGANQRVRRPKTVYEKRYGKLKSGHVIYHIDGDRKNDSIDNLEAISRAELLKRNRELYK